MRSDAGDLLLNEDDDLFLDADRGDLGIAGRAQAERQLVANALKIPRGQWIHDWLFGNEIYRQARSPLDDGFPARFKRAVVDCLSRLGVVKPMSWHFEIYPQQEPRVFVKTKSGESEVRVI